jgi:hypothetical protein
MKTGDQNVSVVVGLLQDQEIENRLTALFELQSQISDEIIGAHNSHRKKCQKQ